jgi:hypothetical protein
MKQDEMITTCSTYRREEMKRRNTLEDLDVNGRIMMDGKLRTGFIWPRTGTTVLTNTVTNLHLP